MDSWSEVMDSLSVLDLPRILTGSARVSTDILVVATNTPQCTSWKNYSKSLKCYDGWSSGMTDDPPKQAMLGFH
jgi:hypothetical protein